MKTIFTLLILSLIWGCTQEPTSYFDNDYKSVFKNAKNENKMVFIDFYTNWCGPCKLFEKEIVTDSIFIDYISGNFLSTKINAEIEENKEIVKKYKITGYPTFIITDLNGDEIDRIVGLKANNSNEFIDAIKKIISGKENLIILEQKYYQNPDSLELFRTIALDKMLSRNLYLKTIEFTDYAERHSNNEELKTEAQLYHAYSMIRKKPQPSPLEMINFVKKERISKQFKEWGFSELYFFYRDNNNMDSVNYYLNALVKGNFNHHLGYVRDYAEFLYKQNKDFEKADSLTTLYSNYGGNYADHWTPYLKAHRCARHGDMKQGIEVFNKWMDEYSKPENFMDDFWHYYFYIEFTSFYRIPSSRAVKYAETIENYKSSAQNKKSLALVYSINGMKQDAIKKLREAKELYEDPNQKNEAEKLINEYSKN